MIRIKFFLAAGLLLAILPTGCDQKRETQVASVRGLTHSIVQALPSTEASDKKEIDVRSFVDKAASRILLPKSPLTGPPVEAENWGDGQIPKESVGLRILYSNGVEFAAEPVPPGERGLDVEAKQAAAKWQPYSDNRKTPFEVVSARSNKVAVQRGGTQQGPVHGIMSDVIVNPALQWQEDEVIYTLRSDTLDADSLLAIMETMQG